MTTKLPPSLIDDGTPDTILATLPNLTITEYPKDWLSGRGGLIMSWVNGNTISLTPGIRYNPDTLLTCVLTSTLTKRLDLNWIAGNNQGGLDTGTRQPSTTYHVHLIANNTTFAADILFSLSQTAPTVPVGWSFVRRLGTIFNNSTNAIPKFKQVNKTIFWENGLGVTTTGPLNTAVQSGIATFDMAGMPNGVPLTIKWQTQSFRANGNIRLQVYGNGQTPTADGAEMYFVQPLSADVNAYLNISGELFLENSNQLIINYVTFVSGGFDGHRALTLTNFYYTDHSL